MMRAIAIALALPLIGCAATTHWEKPGAVAGEFDADNKRCEYEANLGTPGSPVYTTGQAISGGLADGLRIVQLREMCMQAKGWARVANNP